MFLYHGTGAENISNILSLGLIPRGIGEGSWPKLESRNDAVYLSDAYAPFYADHCNQSMGCLVEIDLDFLEQKYFYPDEDFLEQSHQNLDVGDTLEDRTRWFRDNLKSFQHLWQESLQELGNCCYMACIPLSAISRITKWSVSDLDLMRTWNFPMSVSIENYRAEGEFYCLLTKCFAKRTVDIDKLLLLAEELDVESNFDKEEYKSRLIKEIEQIMIVYDHESSHH